MSQFLVTDGLLGIPGSLLIDGLALAGPSTNAASSAVTEYLGRYRLGQVALLGLVTRDASGKASLPTAAPTADLYDDTSTLVLSAKIPAADPDAAEFQLPLFLGNGFSRGRYRVTYRYQVGTYAGARVDSFEVVDGGDTGGAIISLFAYDRPEGRYVLGQTAAGRLVQGRNPRF